MRDLLVSLYAGAALAWGGPATALEKTSAWFDADDDRNWQTANSINLSYFNVCTGWVWVWSGWSPNDRVGVSYEATTTAATTRLDSNWWFFGTGAPGGYGYTGTVDVHRADRSTLCPVGAPLRSQSFLPSSGWNIIGWGTGVAVYDDPFVVSYVLGDTAGNPVALWTDHPARGPTGPQACGHCYPETRTTRSFYFGTEVSPLCPGSVLNDGICDSHFIQDAQVCCYDGPASVEPESWSDIKAMYR